MIGEKMRGFEQNPWVTGLFLLVAAGHMGDAVAITSQWLSDMDEPKRFTDRAWHMLALSPILAMDCAFDKLTGFLDMHITQAAIDDLAARAILEQFRDARVFREIPVTSKDAAIFVARELAKEAWAQYDLHADEIAEIAECWFKNKTLPAVEKHALIRSSVSVGKASDVGFEDREIASLALYGLWLTSVELGSRDLYARPIAKRYQIRKFE